MLVNSSSVGLFSEPPHVFFSEEKLVLKEDFPQKLSCHCTKYYPLDAQVCNCLCYHFAAISQHSDNKILGNIIYYLSNQLFDNTKKSKCIPELEILSTLNALTGMKGVIQIKFKLSTDPSRWSGHTSLLQTQSQRCFQTRALCPAIDSMVMGLTPSHPTSLCPPL